MLSPREREKRERDSRRDEREGQGRKMNRNASDHPQTVFFDSNSYFLNRYKYSHVQCTRKQFPICKKLPLSEKQQPNLHVYPFTLLRGLDILGRLSVIFLQQKEKNQAL